MNSEELGKLYPIIIENYNPKWVELYEKEKGKLLQLLGDKILSIHHIGSTAIKGIKAKPTIDILVEINDDVEEIKNILSKNGYIFMTEQKQHIMFVKGYLPTGFDSEVYHIHMGSKDLKWLFNRIHFKNYLNEFPMYKAEYENLKLKLMKKYKNNRDGYTNAKTDFVERITKIAVKYYNNK